MKNKVFLFLIISISLIFNLKGQDKAFIATLSAHEQDWLQKNNHVSIFVTTDWPPYEYIDSLGKYKGYSADVLAFLSKKVGLTYQLKTNNPTWSQIQDSIKEKKVDVLPSVFVTTDRAKFMNFTSSYLTISHVVVCKSDNNSIRNINDLKQVRVGFMREWAIQKAFKEKYPEITQILSDTTELLISNLLFGKSDAAVMDLATLSYLLKKHNIGNLKVAFVTEFNMQLALAVRKDWPELATILNKAMIYYQPNMKLINNEWFSLLNPQNQIDNKYIYSIAVIILSFLLLGLFWIYLLRRLVKRRTAQLEKQMKISKLNAEELAESERRYELLFNSASDAILILDKNLITDCNYRAEELFGMSRNSIRGLNIIDLSPLYQEEKILSSEKAEIILYNALQGEEMLFDWKHRRSNGELFDAEIRIKRFEIGNKKLLNVILRDISQRRNSEKELSQYRNHLEELVREKTEEYEVLNEELVAMNEELVATNMELATANSDLNEAVEKLEEEIAQHRETQLKLRESEEKFSSFIYQSAEGMNLIDLDGNLMHWNRQLGTIIGNPRVLVPGSKIWDIAKLVFTENSDPVIEKIMNFIEQIRLNFNEATPIVLEGTVMLTNGQLKSLHSTLFPIITPKGAFIGQITRDITEKLRIEKELENYRLQLENLVVAKTEDLNFLSDRFNDVFENTSDAFAFFDLYDNQCILNATNIVMRNLLGNTIDEKSKAELSSLFASQTAADLYRMVNLCLDSKLPTSRELEIYFNGEKRIVDTLIIPDKEQESKNRRIAIILRDNTERRNMEYQIRESETRFRTLVENLPFEFWVLYNKERYSYFNPTSESKWVHGVEHMLDDERIPVHIKSLWQKHSKRSLAGELVREESMFDYGSLHYYLNILSPIWINDEIAGVIGMNIDITDQKLAEKKIGESEQKFNKVFNTSLDALSLIDCETNKYIEINQGFINIFNLNHEQVIGCSRDELNLWFDEFTKERYQQLLNHHGFLRNIEMRWRTFDGRERWFLVSSEYLEIQGRKHLLTISRDISEKYEIEKALRISEHKFRNIFESSIDGIIIASNKYDFLDVNPSFLNLIGYTAEELYQKKIYSITPKRNFVILADRQQALMRQETVPAFELEIIRKDNQILTVEINSMYMEYENQPASLSIMRDITERRQMELQLHEITVEIEESERRKLAADLHDEVGPLLSSMNLYLSSLARKPEVQAYNTHIDNITRILKEAITSVREISNNLSPHILANYGLESAISAFFETKRNLISVNFEHSILKEALTQSIEIMLYRVTKELFNNTIKHSNASQVNVILNVDESMVKMTYNDNGKGFIIGQQSERGQGIGLVSIVNRVKSLGGSYQIDSTPGNGFKFELFVPLK